MWTSSLAALHTLKRDIETYLASSFSVTLHFIFLHLVHFKILILIVLRLQQ